MFWVRDHLDDIASDLSVFHRIDDMYAMTGPRFFTFACRLSAYAGVMQARVAAALEDDRPAQPSASAGPGRRGDTYVPTAVTAESVALDPTLAGLFSIGKPE